LGPKKGNIPVKIGFFLANMPKTLTKTENIGDFIPRAK
jgi:hypothetical protein